MVKYPYVDIDSIVISILKDYVIESAPEIKNITRSFGKYKTSYTFQNDIFTYKNSQNA